MAGRYLPKIKTETVKQIAQKFALTKGGKKVSATAFKKFLREDEDLKHLTYAGKTAKLSKYKAEKTLGRVFEKLGGHEKFRANPIAARQAGFRIGAGGKLSSVGLKKLYSYAAQDQLKAEAPKGPSPEEQAKAARREAMLKSLHKRERSDEIRKDQLKPVQPVRTAGSGFRPVPIMQGLGFSSSMNVPPGSRGRPYQPTQVFSRRKSVTIAFLPVSNLSGTAEIGPVAERIHQMFLRLPKRFPNLVVSRDEQIEKTLRNLDWQDGRPWDRPLLERVAKDTAASIVLFGEAQRVSNVVEVRVAAYLPSRNDVVRVGESKETVDRTIELEQRMNWSINETFEEQFFGKPRTGGSGDADIPSAAEAKELPI